VRARDIAKRTLMAGMGGKLTLGIGVKRVASVLSVEQLVDPATPTG